MSQSLFIIAAEALSKGLKHLHAPNKQVQYHTTIGVPPVSHLGYADDIMLFCNGSSFSLKKHVDFLSATMTSLAHKLILQNLASSQVHLMPLE